MFDIRGYEISLMSDEDGEFKDFYCLDVGAKCEDVDSFPSDFKETEVAKLNELKAYAKSNDIPFDEQNRFLFEKDEDRTFVIMKFLTNDDE